MAFRQLLYHSRGTRSFGDDGLKELLVQSRENNRQHDVTGLLFYVNQHFLQCIEGHPDEIEQLIFNIRCDGRNEDVSVLVDRRVEGRGFEGWAMGFRAMTMAELRDEPGFRDLRSAADLANLQSADELVLTLMQTLYRANAGRSF